MPNYVRAYVPGGPYFFTVAILDRRRRLLVDNIEALREAFRYVRHLHPFHTDAIAVLPDHLHCIWTLPANDADFSTRWCLIKSRFSHAIDPGEPLSRRRVVKRERGVWQRRFWEHAIRDPRDFERHLDYIHFNPVKHGCAKNVADWPFSSFHRFVRSGMYPPEWAAPLEIQAWERE